jgi:hypothetical protein
MTVDNFIPPGNVLGIIGLIIASIFWFIMTIGALCIMEVYFKNMIVWGFFTHYRDRVYLLSFTRCVFIGWRPTVSTIRAVEL